MSSILTLAEAARLLKVAPVTLYRKARKGEIPAAKLGKSWRFHREQLEDWIRQLSNRPMRPQTSPDLFRHLSTRETDAVLEFSDSLRSRYRHLLDRVVLYGSRARGDFRANSDIDLLLVFKGNLERIQNEISELTNNFNLQEGVMIQTTLLSNKEWENPSFRSFLMVERVKREGITLYG